MNIVRVLVVDDSAYVRKVVKQMLSRSPFIEVVGTARDGAEALELVAELKPDVVTCDLIMPELDGVGFVREQMARRPVPIVIVSVASESGELVLAALDAGAVDFVQKPTALATDKLLEIGDELIEKVKAAAQAPLRAGSPARRRAAAVPRRRGSRRAPCRHRRHRHLDRRSAGAQVAHPAAAGRLAGADRDGAAHAGRLHRDCTRGSSNELSALTWSKRRAARKSSPGMVYPGAGRPPPDVPPRRRRHGRARTSTCGRSTRRTGRRSTCCSSRRPTSTARACSAS